MSVSRTRPPNLLTVVLDCVREGSVRGPDHGAGAKTPILDALARRGSRFSRAVAPGNWTLPSHMSMMTGTYPSVHRLRTFQRPPSLPPTVQGWLQRRGYETALFTETLHLVGGWGLESGFERSFARNPGTRGEDRTLANRLVGHSSVLYSPFTRKLIARLPPAVLPINAFNFRQEVAYKQEVCGEYLIEDFDGWLTKRTPDRPFHAFFNFADGHEPYPLGLKGSGLGFLSRAFGETPRFYLLAVEELGPFIPWKALERGYLGAIETLDAKLGRLLDVLARRGESERTMVIVTSDHGQSFGEQGNVYHGCGVSESVTRVPLVVAPAAGVSLPAHPARWTSLCEISSWMKAAALGREPFDEEGFPTVPFAEHPPETHLTFCEGGPASDPNQSLQGVASRRRWNHRQLAVYRNEEKHTLDLVTGELWRWSSADRSDFDPPEVVVGPAALELRRGPFSAYSGRDPLEEASALVAPGRPPLDDARMRSWGYD